jgi:hypothetical protein
MTVWFKTACIKGVIFYYCKDHASGRYWGLDCGLPVLTRKRSLAGLARWVMHK